MAKKMTTTTKKTETSAETKEMEHVPVYINPLTDCGIKRVFFMPRRGSERLISFLRAFLPDIMKDVVSITYKPTELLGDSESEKRVVFDIYCVTNTGRHFIIEMQRAKQSFFNNRIITYDSRVVSGEVERGDMEYNHDVRDAMNVAREDGRKEGREEGREERTRQLALNMLAEGLDSTIVAKITGLTEKEIRTIACEA